MTDAARERGEEGLRAGAECHAAALAYLARGWSPLCLCPPDHVGVGREHGRQCDHPGKRPLPDGGTWKRWQEERPSARQLEDWWKAHPNANVGLALGPVSGVVRVDVEGTTGEARLQELSGGDLPETTEFSSGAGRGLLYAIPPGVELRTTSERGEGAHQEVRIQAKGAQTVLPPSRHHSGRRYEWVVGGSPDQIAPAPAPKWLLDLLAPSRARESSAPLAEGELIPEGRRDDTLTSMAGTMRRRGFDEAAILAALKVTNERCDPPLPEDQVAKIARSVGRYAPDPLAGTTIPFRPRESDSAKAPPLPRAWSHDELLDYQFPPLEWLVTGLLPDGGLTILGGKKKLGKSWLCLQISQAVANGNDTLGKTCSKGDVAYICLEDGGRRLQNRLAKQGSPRGLPITWYTSFPKLDGAGMDELVQVAEKRPRLIVLDTLAAAKSGRVDENASGPMADLANALREIAQQYGVGVLVTHHHGKVSYGDPGDDLRGSSALAAAADVNLGLYKGDDGFRLRGEGRDIEPCDYAIRFDAHGEWKWLMIGDARTLARDEADQELLLALSHLGESDAGQVAQFVNKSRRTVSERLSGLVVARRVLSRSAPADGRGRPAVLYRLPDLDAADIAEP